MCGICGCEQTTIHQHTHNHHHDHVTETKLITIEQDILEANNKFAAQNRHYFKQHRILAFNFISAPGSGKTSLLVKTLIDLNKRFSFAVIEGDQQTELDAARIAATGAPVRQINTGKICHLDAHMVSHALEAFPQLDNAILFIENVGNLVCPTLFDLGESARIVLLSVTEGEDKPLKYPYIFETADVVILNKMDLLPYVDFDVDRCMAYAQQINPEIKFIQTSIKAENGLSSWYQWLENRISIICSAYN